MHRPMHLA